MKQSPLSSSLKRLPTDSGHAAGRSLADLARDLPVTRYRDAVRHGRGRVRLVLALVVTVSALLVGLVQPPLTSCGFNANESAAIATLKNISSAQSQVQVSCMIDANGNGEGEYGFFAELAGVTPLRTTNELISQPVLSRSFGNVAEGCVQRSGYCFQLFLPNPDGGWACESACGEGAPKVAAKQSEASWLCYAWPLVPGTTGSRAFFINQSGEVLATDMAGETYRDIEGPVPGVSAFAADCGGSVLAVNVKDARGNVWVVVA